MSGITPILDTLLHQVLGRRDGVAERALSEQPISPPRAARAAARLHSDSRLDPRPLPAPATHTVGGREIAARGRSAAGTPVPAAPRSASMPRLSLAARAIADVLARFPAPPSAVRTSRALLAASERGDAAALATRLRGSIEGSGLFYESHLRRWRSGAFPLQRLMREPQMRMSVQPPAVSDPPQPGGDGARARGAKASAAAPVPAPDTVKPASTTASVVTSYAADGKPLPVTGGLAPSQSSWPVDGGTPLTATDAQVVRPGLEHVLRHQLEMLAVPVLRWEGEPWAGVFMALMLQPPAWRPDENDPSDTRDSSGAADTPWHSRLRLDMPGLGEVTIDLRLGPQHVALEVEAAEMAAADALQSREETLRERLLALGFRDVMLGIRVRDTQAGDAHD